MPKWEKTTRNEYFYESKDSTNWKEEEEKEFLKMDEHVERRRVNEPSKLIGLNQFEDAHIKGWIG